MSLSAQDLREAVRQHLYAHLGPAGEAEVLEGNPLPGSPVQRLDLPFFYPEGPLTVAVFATIGASAFAMPDGGRLEGLFLCREPPERDAFTHVHALLAAFATQAEATGATLDFGDVVPAQALLAPLAPMDAVLLLPPVPVSAELAHLALPNEARVDFAWLMPVFEDEAEFAIREGAQRLMALFAFEQVDPCDLGRRRVDVSRAVPDVGALQQALGQDKPIRGPSFTAETDGQVIHVTRRTGRRPR